jgi:assimilatory nitrate reductase catalytic subunit
MTETPSTCPYCGVGCGVLIEHDITGVRATRTTPPMPAGCAPRAPPCT